MRRIRIALFMVSFAAALPGAMAGEPAPLARIAWLGGCWHSVNGEPGSGEQWMPLAGGTLLGVGRTVRQGRTIEHEFLQIREKDGKLVYIALPSGQTMAEFTAIRQDDREVVFENLQHDFPQRIIYRLQGERELHARIEGMRNGVLKGIDFPLARVSCDATVEAGK